MRREIVNDKKELDRKVDDYLIKGYKINHRGIDKVGVSKKYYGDLIKHILIAVSFVGGIIIVLFIVNYFTHFMTESDYLSGYYTYLTTGYDVGPRVTTHNEYYLLGFLGLIANLVYLFKSYQNNDNVIIEVENTE